MDDKCGCIALIYIYIYIYTYTNINAKLGTNSTFAAELRKTTENLLKHEISEINISNSVPTWQKRTRILHKDQMVTAIPFQWSGWLGDIPIWAAWILRSQFETCMGHGLYLTSLKYMSIRLFYEKELNSVRGNSACPCVQPYVCSRPSISAQPLGVST